MKDSTPTYYGRIGKKKPKWSIDYMILDEHMQKIVDKHLDIFKTKAEKISENIKKIYQGDISILRKEIKEIRRKLLLSVKSIESLKEKKRESKLQDTNKI